MSSSEESSSRQKLQVSTIGLLAATGILAGAAALVGIADNPPGIILLYCSGLTLVLAFAHRWQTPDRFLVLFLGAVLGFFIFVFVHNFAEVGADRISHLPVLAFLLSAVSVVGFIAAVIVCPMAGAVGALGWVAKLDKKARKGD